MQKNLINFENIPWKEVGKGVRYKVFQRETQQIRLVEFSEGFAEEDWCTRGHAGYVIEGCCSIDFDGSMECYKVGDAFFISKEDRHKVIMNKGEKVLLILFETI